MSLLPSVSISSVKRVMLVPVFSIERDSHATGLYRLSRDNASPLRAAGRGRLEKIWRLSRNVCWLQDFGVDKPICYLTLIRTGVIFTRSAVWRRFLR
jgi:hypothetical protein